MLKVVSFKAESNDNILRLYGKAYDWETGMFEQYFGDEFFSDYVERVEEVSYRNAPGQDRGFTVFIHVKEGTDREQLFEKIKKSIPDEEEHNTDYSHLDAYTGDNEVFGEAYRKPAKGVKLRAQSTLVDQKK